MKIEEISSDGISMNFIDYINALDDEEFSIYLDYHFKNCNRKDLLGYSTHIYKVKYQL